MNTSTADVASTKVITGLVRFSYLHVFEAVSVEADGEKKFSTALLIPKSDKKTLALIKAAIDAAKEQGKAKLGGKIPANLKTPLRDGDIDRPEDDNYADCYFINANAKSRPGVVDINRKPILNQDEIYSGCYGVASITFFAYAGKSKGIACGLNHIMKVKDGEALGGRSTAENDFADLEVDALVEEDDFM